MGDLLGRRNNFDFLRLLFSSLVIFSHSFPLTKNKEILAVYTKNQIDFGSFSVNVFFAISGYLIFNSLKFSKTPINYLFKRCLRLFPALFLMLLISLIIISFVYSGENILSEKGFYTYLPNNLILYRVQFNIKNVFESNPYPNAINGSLWSLSYEFTMYLFLLLLYPIRNNRPLVTTALALCLLASFLCATLCPTFLNNLFTFLYLNSFQMYRLATFFIFGSILSLFNLNKINSNTVKVGLVILIIFSLFLNVYNYTSYIFIPTLVILVGISYSKILAFIPEKIGDISYGVYIYGFIIQQTFMNYLNLNPYQLTLLTLPVAYIFSYFSWHFVESKFLKYKNYIQ